MKNGWAHLKGLDIPEPVADQPVEMILGCESLALFEAIKPSASRGPKDPVARLTCIGWMIGGKTCPEPSAEAEGESRMVSGDCGVVRAGPVPTNDKVRSKTSPLNIRSDRLIVPFTEG